MLLFSIISALVVVVDQIFKYLIRANVQIGNVFSTFLPFLKITYVKNTGAAFGSMAGMRIQLIVFSLFMVAATIYQIFIKNKIKDKHLIIPIALALGGAISNLYDRIVYGYVTDYIKITLFSPVCNIADYCICLGTAFALIIYFKKKTPNFN